MKRNLIAGYLLVSVGIVMLAVTIGTMLYYRTTERALLVSGSGTLTAGILVTKRGLHDKLLDVLQAEKRTWSR